MVAAFVLLVSLQVVGFILVQIPGIQTWIGKKIVASVSQNLNGEISIGKTYIVFFNKVIIKDISIVSTDKSPLLDSLKANYNQCDTLLACNKLSLSLDPAELLKMRLKLNKIHLTGGVFNLQSEGERVTNLDRIFKLEKDKPKDTTKSGINLLANTLKIEDFRFTLNNPDKVDFRGDSIVNFSNLDVKDINIDISDIHLKQDTIYASVNNISAIDKSGFALREFSGNARVCGTETLVSNLHAEDNYSVLNTKFFYLKYDSPRDFADFTTKVEIGTALDDTYVDFKTIGRIAPTLFNSSLAFYLNGELSGTVDDIDTKSLIATSKSGRTFIELSARILGLPDVRRTMAIAEIKQSYTTCNDVAVIVASINNTPKNRYLASITPFNLYSFKGTLSGLLDDFVINGGISSRVGDIDLDILFRNESGKGVRFDGKVATESLDLGRILANNMLGEVTMRSGINAFIGSGNSGMEVDIDSIRIEKLHFNDYDYTGIYAEGRHDTKEFNGKIICHDPNLDFIFQGLFTFGNEGTSKYDFMAYVPHADLAALKIDKRYGSSVVSLNSSANFTRYRNRHVVGRIDVRNTKYKNHTGEYNLGSITLQSLQGDSTYRVSARAPFIKADYYGCSTIFDFINKTRDIVYLSKIDNYLERDTTVTYNDGYYRLNVETFNTRGVCQALMPGLYIMDSTKVNLTINRSNSINATVKSGRIAYEHNFFKNLDLRINGGYNRDTRIDLNAGQIRAAGMSMDSNILNLVANENKLDLKYSFRNDSTGNNNANIAGEIEFKPQKEVDIKIKDGSGISLKGERWNLTPALIALTDSLITIEDFNIKNGEQLFAMNGNISRYLDDSLSFKLSNFDIGIFNLFLNKSFNLEGIFSGSALVSDLYRTPKVFLDINGDSVYVFGSPVGSLKLMSKWNNNDKVLNLLAKSNLNDKVTFTATGYYKPQNSYLDLRASLEELSVCYFEPFLSDLISKSSGSLSGELKLSGSLDKLALTGENCHFKDLGFTVNFTNVPYRLNGPVELDERGIYFKNLPIYDEYGSRGSVNGNLTYNYFRDLAVNTNVNFTNLQCLKTTEKDNEFFYGDAFATGSLAIKGPLNRISMNIDVLSNARTSIHIPLSSSATATQTNILTFVDEHKNTWIDPYESYIMSTKEEKAPSQLDVQLRANLTPQADIMIEINKSVGDVIKANGNGLINMDINPSKDVFDIFGDYHVNNGSYKFVLAGFAAKDFTLEKGGTINFNGDISNTNIDLDAVYHTKASINTLIADTSSVSTRRNVNCTIGMQGKLTNPELEFAIDIPDLDPTTKMRVESALNTQGKIQKQFMALIVSGGFIPDEQSGIANNSSILYSNASEILSNQINMIFQQLGIPLDLGLNYQPGERGTDIFDVAVSTQLFNNRVIINGNIGNDPSETSRSVIGNIDVEIKLDNPGNTRLNLFSHAEDQYSSYNDNNNSQRSGVGIVYQKEFNSFKSLFKGKSKAQKAYEKQEREKRKRMKKEEAK